MIMHARQLAAKSFGDMAISCLLLLAQENHSGVPVFSYFICFKDFLPRNAYA